MFYVLRFILDVIFTFLGWDEKINKVLDLHEQEEIPVNGEDYSRRRSMEIYVNELYNKVEVQRHYENNILKPQQEKYVFDDDDAEMLSIDAIGTIEPFVDNDDVEMDNISPYDTNITDNEKIKYEN